MEISACIFSCNLEIKEQFSCTECWIKYFTLFFVFLNNSQIKSGTFPDKSSIKLGAQKSLLTIYFLLKGSNLAIWTGSDVNLKTAIGNIFSKGGVILYTEFMLSKYENVI